MTKKDISRRKMIGIIAAGTAAIATGAAFKYGAIEVDDTSKEDTNTNTKSFSGENGSKFKKNIIIIGAGISGLAAAEKLASEGYDALILEATDKVGGRIQTTREPGFAFDLGASWIHGTKDNPITKLAKNAKNSTREYDFENISLYLETGEKISTKEYKAAEAKLEEIISEISKNAQDAESFKTAIDRLYPNIETDPTIKFLLSNYLTFDTGELTQLSAQLVVEGEEFSGPEVVIGNGYDLIAKQISKDLEIKYNEQVKQINTKNNEIKITTNNDIYTSQNVVVTVPLGTLKAQTIEFKPPLSSEKQKAIANLGFSTVNKFAIQFNDTFWDDTDFLGLCVNKKLEQDIATFFLNVNKIQKQSHTLMTFAYGEAAQKSEIMSDEEILELITTNIEKMYPTKAISPIRVFRSKWHSDPNAKGSYTFLSTNSTLEDIDILATQQDQIHFAGEHTHREYFSTAHGAYLSGQRAAQEILDSFRQQ